MVAATPRRVDLQTSAVYIRRLRAALEPALRGLDRFQRLEVEQQLAREALAQVLAAEYWRGWIDEDTREEVHHATFADFVRATPPRGLGMEVDAVRRLISALPAALGAFEIALAAPVGRPAKMISSGKNETTQDATAPEPEAEGGDESAIDRTPPPEERDGGAFARARRDADKPAPAGNTRSYAAKRLAKERPDLLQRVDRGELSFSAAMLEAGLKKAPPDVDVIFEQRWEKYPASRQTETAIRLLSKVETGTRIDMIERLIVGLDADAREALHERLAGRGHLWTSLSTVERSAPPEWLGAPENT